MPSTWISTFLLIVSLSLPGCALFQDRPGPPKIYGPQSQIFYASFDEVWTAVNLVMQPYPLRISNRDKGTLETDVFRGFQTWTPPYAPNSATAGESYQITIHVVRGNTQGAAATKVLIEKDIKLQKDFFAEAATMPSDGMQEETILYRIGREIQIHRAIVKAAHH